MARNAIPGWMADLPVRWTDSDAAVVVGWQGGASRHGLEWVRQGVRKAMAQFKMSKLRLVGQDYRKLIRLDAAQMDYVPWYRTSTPTGARA